MPILFSKEDCLDLNHMLFVRGLGIMPGNVPKDSVPAFPMSQLMFHTMSEQTVARSMVKTYREFGLNLRDPQNRLLDKSDANTMGAFAQWCSENAHPRFE